MALLRVICFEIQLRYVHSYLITWNSQISIRQTYSHPLSLYVSLPFWERW